MILFQILEGMVSSPFTGFALAIFSIMLGIFLFLKSMRRTRIYYAIYEGSRSVDNVSGASLKHPGEKAELIGVNVAIWSSGTNLIKSNDIAPQDPLFIHTVSRSPIVFSTVAKQTDSARNIVLQVFPDDPANLGISFDYLNPRDGAVFSIFYEGQVDEEIKVKGSIMGGNAPEKRQGLDMISPRLTVSLFLLGLVIFFFGITISATSAIVGALSLTLGVIFYPISLILAVNIHRQRAMPSTLKDSFLETPCVLTLVMRKSYESSPFKEIDRIMKKYRDESEQ